jgi:hypothetical protein
MHQIDLYRFSLSNLFEPQDQDLTDETRSGRRLTGGQLGFQRERSGSNMVDESGLLGAGECNEEVRRDTMSPTVLKVASIACWCEARVWLERAVAAGIVQRLRQNGHKMAAGFWQRKSRGGGAIYRGDRLGRGARVRDVAQIGWRRTLS